MADESSSTPPTTTTQQSGGDTQTKATGLDALMEGDQRVGPLGIIITGSLLILLTVTLLVLFTRQWPACNDLGTEADDTAGGAAVTNQNTAPQTGNGNTNANAARPAANANAGNANASANTNANTSANTNANTNANLPGGQSANANAGGGAAGAEQPSGESPTKPILRSIEPKQGPITGKTMVTLKGENFGADPTALVVKFGETKAAVTTADDKSISVSTGRHSEGVVDVSVTKDGRSDVLEAAYTYQCPSPAGSTLFWMIIMAGALGGSIHAMRSLFWYAGQRDLKWSWMPMYFLLPFIGAAMSLIFGMLMVAGFFNPSSTGSSQALVMIALAGLVGMFSQQAALKLKDIAEAVFTKPQEGSDSKPQKSLPPSGDTTATTAALTATALSVTSGDVAGGDAVTITGEGFSSATTVTFGGDAAQITATSPTSITVLTPSHATPETVDVVVKSGNQTASPPLQFEYTSSGLPEGEVPEGENESGENEGGENAEGEIVEGELPEGESEGGENPGK